MGQERPYILMVDDEPDFQTVVGAWLEPRYEHCAIKDADEFAGAVRVRVPDLAILDVMMPGTDGLELCRRLRGDPRTKDVPVLFLTGRRNASDYDDMMKAGGTGYLAKPVSREQLLKAIADILARAAARRAADAKAEQPQ